MGTPPPSRLLHQLIVAAHAARLFADRVSLDAANVTTAQAAVLYVLAEAPGSSQRQVGHALRVSEASAGQMCARLEGAGLVIRDRSPDDARAVGVWLTDAGTAAIAAVSAQRLRVNELLVKGLSKADLEIVSRFLDGVSERMGGEDRR